VQGALRSDAFPFWESVLSHKTPAPEGRPIIAQDEVLGRKKKDSGTTNPPVQPKIIPPAHLSLDNRSAARSILSQVMESFSILTLPHAKLRRGCPMSRAFRDM